jgi:O-antigen ligase
MTPTIGGIHIFHLRTDADGAILGITAALALVRWSRGLGIRNLLVALISWGLILPLTSRAALLGAVSAAVLAAVVIQAQRNEQGGKANRQLIVVLLPVAILIIAAILPQTTVGSRLVTSFGSPESSVGLSGAGTTQARQDAWGTLAEYTLSEPVRALAGVGFGPDFMIDSGAGTELLGRGADLEESGVRSPHNYYLGTMARLGLVGVVLVIAISMSAIALAWRHRSVMARDDLVATAGFIVVGMVAPAAFGVLLESPFGAVPYFWSLGLLMAVANVSSTVNPRLKAAVLPKSG